MPEIWEENVGALPSRNPLHLAEKQRPKKVAPIWERFQSAEEAQEAILMLDAGGAIQALTPAARRLLGYRPEQPYKPSFFSHVHANDLYRVMRDVAEMTFHGRQEADWELRLRTGEGGWHWFSASVGNQLDQPESAICIHLTEPQA